MKFTVTAPHPDILSIREDPASDPLVQRLAHVHVTGWKQAYGTLLPEKFYNDEALTDRAQMWGTVLSRADAPDRVRIATAHKDEGTRASTGAGASDITADVIGFSIHGDARDNDRAGIELFALYILAEHYGSGVGQRLLDAAIGQAPACLWGAADNPRAIRFYEKNGFQPDGTRKKDPEIDDLEEMRMVRG